MRRLHSRVFLHFLAVAVLVWLAIGAVFTSGWRSAFPRLLTERFVMFGASEVAERFDDPVARERWVRKMGRQLDVDVTVRAPDGAVLVASDRVLPPLSDDELRAAAGSVTFHHRGNLWFAVGPIADPATGRLRGYLEATPLRRFKAPSPIRPLLLAVALLAIVAGLSVPLARRIARPVERLTDATRRFGAGDLSARVPVWPDGEEGRHGHHHGRHWRRAALKRRWRGEGRLDEIGELSRAWNEMADRVERLVRGQKELLANVSHELRSPLARIRMALELLPRQPDDEARIRDIEGDLADLDQLIEDVLTASRLQAARLPARLESVDVAPLLAGLVDRAKLDPLVAGHAVQVEAGAADLRLVADGALLRRALWNLVENAAKYGRAPITLSARLDGGRVQLAVSDEGDGIPAADRQRVLDAFERIDRARTPSAAGEPRRGFGLGLTIARRVAEVHGGVIRIGPARTEGGVERGCRIVLDLPREPPPTAAA